MTGDQVPTLPIALEGALNFRDLGGHATDDGHTVRRWEVFRSGSLSALADVDLAALGQLEIRTVIDFRLASQIEIFGPDRLPDGAQYVSLPMGGGDVSSIIHEAMETGRFASLPDVATVNRAIMREDGAQLTTFIRIVADPERLPLIFHCIGGKDRTGIAAALLLSILGVPWATVREDYVRSNEQLADAIDAELAGLVRAAAERSGRDPEPVDLAAAKRFSTVQAGDLDAAGDAMIEEAGSIEAYLRDRLSISEETMQSLRHQLLE
jgi:protein-tyrosine phosphatase